MMRFLSALGVLVIACASPASSGDLDLHGVDAPPIPTTTEAEVAPYRKPGTAVIRGRVVAKLEGVPVLFYRRVEVDLVPAVPYMNWVIDNGMRKTRGYPILGPAPKYTQPLLGVIRSTLSGPTGEYSFLDVPALPYVVSAIVEENESRTGTSYNTEFSTVPVYQPDGSEEFQSQSSEVPSSYSYTCHSRGWLFGYVIGVANETTPASLAAMYDQNNGC